MSRVNTDNPDRDIDNFVFGIIEYIRTWDQQILDKRYSSKDIIRCYVVWNKMPSSLFQRINTFNPNTSSNLRANPLNKSDPGSHVMTFKPSVELLSPDKNSRTNL
jgi:hypothetical protein